MTGFIIGLICFALISLILCIHFTKKVQWQKNYRQQQNIVLYQQQLGTKPDSALAKEFAERLLLDEQQSESALTIKSTVGFSKKLSIGLWAILVIIPLTYYFSLNRFDAAQDGQKAFAEKQTQLATVSAEDKNMDYVISIQNRLRKDPNNVQDWVELGQAYMLSNDYQHAIVAYSNAEKIEGSKPYILGLAATTLYYQAGQKITPQVQEIINLALTEDPKEASSLSLLASDAFIKNDFKTALDYWQRLLDTEQSSVDRREIIKNMNMARMLENSKTQRSGVNE